MEYAQTRMQARYGARPSEEQWQRLFEHREFATYLAAVRTSPLGGWIAGIGDDAGPHEIESALRRQWYAAVAELARWLPDEWRNAVRWTAALIELPARAHRVRGGVLPPGREREVTSAAAADDLEAWLAGWVGRWPEGLGDDAAVLRDLRRRIEAHLVEFAGLAPESAWEARRIFAFRLRHSFRELAMRPPVAFIFLLTQALDLERLRGELVARALRRRRAP